MTRDDCIADIERVLCRSLTSVEHSIARNVWQDATIEASRQERLRVLELLAKQQEVAVGQ